MFFRALLAFLALPGIVAFALPAILARVLSAEPDLNMLGASLFLFGATCLLWCVRDFYVIGKGTLAPWSPPQTLVTDGLYRFTRNPMYLSVLTLLFAWAATYRLPALIVYATTFAIIFQLRVIYGEEPWLAKKYGNRWQTYRQSVPRWLWGLPSNTSETKNET